MDLTQNQANYSSSKYFLNKYFVYIFLVVLVVVNVIFFPDLLNHKDLKLNDMSYMFPHAEDNMKVKTEVKIQEDNKITAELNNNSTEYSTVIASPEEKTDKAEVIPKENINTTSTTSTSNEIEINSSNSTSEIVTPKVEDVTPTTNSDVISIPSDNSATPSSNLTVLEDPKFMGDNSQEKTDDKININSANVSSDNKEVIETPVIQPLEEVKAQPTNENKSSSSYLLLLFLVVSALFISIGMFIYNNQDKLKMVFFANKYPLFREYVYSGYELLHD